MTDEQRIAMMRVREEAQKLNLACAAYAKQSSAILHIAYDREISPRISLEDAILLAQMGGLQ